MVQANAEVQREMVEGELEQCRKSNIALRRRAEAAELRLAQAGVATSEPSAATLQAIQVPVTSPTDFEDKRWTMVGKHFKNDAWLGDMTSPPKPEDTWLTMVGWQLKEPLDSGT